MRTQWCRSTLLALALAGCAPAPTPGESAEPILGGAPDSADPAVGLVWMASTNNWCTGTLVAPTVVLTAAHCLTSPIEGVYFGQGVSEFPSNGMGVTPDSSMKRFGVDKQATDPAYQPAQCANDAHDVGLLRLSSAVIGTQTVPYAKTASDIPAAGVTVSTAGFGWHDDGTIESKYSATETLAVVKPTNLLVNRNWGGSGGIATHGDSGAGLVYNGTIIGTAECHTDGEGSAHTQEVFSRIDLSASFISSTVTQFQDDCTAPVDASYNQCVANATTGYGKCLCWVFATNTKWRQCGVGGPSTIFCIPPPGGLF
jgi:hypothetical protein